MRATGGGGGGGGGAVGVMTHDREEQRSLFALGEKSWKRVLIEGCFKTVKGWQFGIIMVICLRGSTRRWTFNECSMCSESTRADLTFLTAWKSLPPFLVFPWFSFHCLGLQEGCLLVWLLLWRPCRVTTLLLCVTAIEVPLVQEVACWLKDQNEGGLEISPSC